jgi:osmoprotectant transport system substrate-binding protein
VTARYAMLDSGEADVFVGYETDPELQSPKLKVLQDSEGFFPDYDALPVVSTEALLRIAGLQSALDRLQGCITTAELVRLVQKLQHRGQRSAVVRELAEEFLQEKQLAGGLG